MKVIKATSKKHLLEQISQIDGNHDELYINLRPTKEIIEAIAKQCSSLQKLYCPPSLLKQTAKKAIEHAGTKNMQILAGDFDVGRPNKYPEKTVNDIIDQRRSGKPAKSIASEMDIPLRTVYFYLNQKKL